MSVRHIHARPGEYIAVHRGGDTDMTIVGIIAAVLTVVFFLEFILKAILFVCAVLLAVALAAGALYLFWTFRRELWDGICWTAKALWDGTCWTAQTLWSAAGWCWAKCGTVCRTIRKREHCS